MATGFEVFEGEVEKQVRIYVGNLSYQTTEDELRTEFAAYGEVTSVSVMTDRDTGRPKGFAFVEMASKSKAADAIAGLNGKTLNERTLTVNEARPRTEGFSGGGRGGGFGHGYGGDKGGSRGKGGRGRGRY